jgi:hypothetical protein
LRDMVTDAANIIGAGLVEDVHCVTMWISCTARAARMTTRAQDLTKSVCRVRLNRRRRIGYFIGSKIVNNDAPIKGKNGCAAFQPLSRLFL